MNVLVTGAAGFVGKHLTRELVANKHTVVAAINHKEQPIDDAETISVDLSDKDQVESKIDFRHIDAVIHLAGLAVVGASFDEPMKYLEVNAGIEVNLYEACLKQQVRPKMLIVSSGVLYDPTSPMPLTEDSRIAPTNPYGISKVAQELFAQYYQKRGFSSVIVRPFNHIGPGQNPGFIVPDLAQQIIEGEKGKTKEICVGNLDARRDFTDVRDIVNAYRLLIESDVESGIFNVCSGNSISGKELLDMMLARSLARLAIVSDPSKMRPADIQEITGDHTKITSATGWLPQHSLEQTIDDVLADWRSRS